MTAKELHESAIKHTLDSQWIRIFFGSMHKTALSGKLYMTFDDTKFSYEQKLSLKYALDVNGYNYEFAGSGQMSIVCWGISLSNAMDFIEEDMNNGRFTESDHEWEEYLN